MSGGKDESSAAQPASEERTAYVKSLKMEVEESEVQALFATCGALKSVRMPRDRLTNRSRVS